MSFLFQTRRAALRNLTKARPSVRFQSTEASAEYQYILTSTPRPGVGQSTIPLQLLRPCRTISDELLVTLNRPKALNALSSPLMAEVNKALTDFDKSGKVGAVVITGSEKAFAGMRP